MRPARAPTVCPISHTRQAVEQSIRSEVTAIKSQVAGIAPFRAMFLPNLFTGVVASFAFSLPIIAASPIFYKYPFGAMTIGFA